MEDLKIQKNQEIQKKLVESFKEITNFTERLFNDTFLNFEIRKNEERASPETNFRKRSSYLPR